MYLLKKQVEFPADYRQELNVKGCGSFLPTFWIWSWFFFPIVWIWSAARVSNTLWKTLESVNQFQNKIFVPLTFISKYWHFLYLVCGADVASSAIKSGTWKRFQRSGLLEAPQAAPNGPGPRHTGEHDASNRSNGAHVDPPQNQKKQQCEEAPPGLEFWFEVIALTFLQKVTGGHLCLCVDRCATHWNWNFTDYSVIVGT